MLENFKPDSEKYECLSKPFSNTGKAEKAAKDFMLKVGELREKFGIPDLIIHFEVNVQTDDGINILSGGCGWGNQLRQAKLARRAADREFAYLGALVETASAALPELRRALITDPEAETGAKAFKEKPNEHS